MMATLLRVMDAVQSEKLSLASPVQKGRRLTKTSEWRYVEMARTSGSVNVKMATLSTQMGEVAPVNWNTDMSAKEVTPLQLTPEKSFI